MGQSRVARRGVAVLLIALLAAGVVASSPATAGRFLTKKKALKLFYSKSAADARFINVGEKAGDADTLDGKDSTEFLGASAKASDADTLDGKDSSAFQEGCENGGVQAWARVQGSVGDTYSNVSQAYSCAGVQIRVRQAGVGRYYVDFGGGELAPPCQPRIAALNLETDIVLPVFGGTFTDNDIGGAVPNCVVRVEIFDDQGAHTDFEFFTVFLFSPIPATLP